MNETIKILKTRRSIRSFNGKKLTEAEITEIAECGKYAPSAMNRQNVKLFAVQNGDLKQELWDAVAVETGRSGYNMYNADTVILTAAPKESDFRVEDCACAMTNMMNAAASLGIGSVWINQLKGVCDKPKIRAVLDKIGVPGDYAVYGSVALGGSDRPTGDTVKTNEIKVIK